MGMFDKPQYLTGDDGFVQKGDEFWMHDAKMDGVVNVKGDQREQVKLLVSRTRDSDQIVVFTTGTGIVNQVRRMDAADRAQLPMHLRLDQVASTKGNPTNVMTPANMPEAGTGEQESIPF